MNGYRHFPAIYVVLHTEGVLCELENLERSVLLEAEGRFLNRLEPGDHVDNTTREEHNELLIVVINSGHNFRVDIVERDNLTDNVLQERLEGLSAIGEQGVLLLTVVVTINNHKMAVEVSLGELAREKRRVITQSVVSISRPGVRFLRHVQVSAIKIIEERSEAVGTDRSERQESLDVGTFIERVDEGQVIVVGLGIVVVDDLLVVRLHSDLAFQMLGFFQLIFLEGDKLISSGLVELFSEALVSLSRGNTEHHNESGSKCQHFDKAINRIWMLYVNETRTFRVTYLNLNGLLEP